MNDKKNDMIAIFNQLSEKTKAILILFASDIKCVDQFKNLQKTEANILDEIMSNAINLSPKNQDLLLRLTKEIKSQSTENMREIVMELAEIYTESPADFLCLEEAIQSRLRKGDGDAGTQSRV